MTASELRYQSASTIIKKYTVSGRAAFLILTIISVSFLIHSCNLVNSNKDNKGGVGIIIPGISIDGIKLGDSKEKVVELLGEPDGGFIADGLYRAWFGYTYMPPGKSEGLGFSIFFIETDKGIGPVDRLSAHEPYEGQTPEGIRIGSTQSEVIEAYGEPDYFSESELKNGKLQGSMIYCIYFKKFEIGTLEGLVRALFIHSYYPIEENTTSFSCQ